MPTLKESLAMPTPHTHYDDDRSMLMVESLVRDAKRQLVRSLDLGRALALRNDRRAFSAAFLLKEDQAVILVTSHGNPKFKESGVAISVDAIDENARLFDFRTPFMEDKNDTVKGVHSLEYLPEQLDLVRLKLLLGQPLGRSEYDTYLNISFTIDNISKRLAALGFFSPHS